MWSGGLLVKCGRSRLLQKQYCWRHDNGVPAPEKGATRLKSLISAAYFTNELLETDERTDMLAALLEHNQSKDALHPKRGLPLSHSLLDVRGGFLQGLHVCGFTLECPKPALNLSLCDTPST